MSPPSDPPVLSSLLGGGFVAAFLHAALPTHWLPFTLVGRAQGWRASRVLAVVAQGDSFDAAFAKAYSGLEQVDFEGITYRRDIGHQVRTDA